MNDWIAGTVPSSADGPPAPRRWWLVQGTSVLVAADGALPTDAPAADVEPLYLGRLGAEEQWALDVDVVELLPAHESLQPTDLFTLHATLGERGWAIAGRAVQLVEWARTHRYCGRCATATDPVAGERARRCSACGLMAFPRLAPAMIVLIEREDEVLLARGRAFPVPMYSCLAGFVEPGESVEEAVAREVAEEAGVQVTDIRYRSTQPWPFPSSLMIGFHARWAGGEPRVGDAELEDVRWFSRAELNAIVRGETDLHLPPPLAIARQLIDEWL